MRGQQERAHDNRSKPRGVRFELHFLRYNGTYCPSMAPWIRTNAADGANVVSQLSEATVSLHSRVWVDHNSRMLGSKQAGERHQQGTCVGCCPSPGFRKAVTGNRKHLRSWMESRRGKFSRVEIRTIAIEVKFGVKLYLASKFKLQVQCARLSELGNSWPQFFPLKLPAPSISKLAIITSTSSLHQRRHHSLVPCTLYRHSTRFSVAICCAPPPSASYSRPSQALRYP
jgi:hypothetical protein